MISILLSGIDGSAPSGLHALLSPKTTGSHSSFARLLQQQSDLVDTDLEQWLHSLHIEPTALFADLKAAGLNPKALLTELKNTPVLNKELTQALKDNGVPTRLIQSLTETQNSSLPTDLDTSTSSQSHSAPTDTALNFIQSTLFIAQEASSLNSATMHQPLKTKAEPSPRFQTQNTLLPDSLIATHKRIAINPESHVQPTLNIAVSTPDTVNATQRKATPNGTDLRFDSSTTNKSPHTATFSSSATLAQPESQESLRQNLAAFQTVPTLGVTDTTVGVSSPQLVSAPLQSMPALPPNYSAHLPTPVTHNQWGSDLGRVVVTLSQHAQLSGPQNAEIRLDPPELGPLRIMLSVTDNIAHATIYAAHAQTRLIVEHALPQLQQQLAQSGLSLGETNVSDQGFTGHSEQNPSQQQASATFNLEGNVQAGGHSALPELNEGTQRLVPDAIIDTFA